MVQWSAIDSMILYARLWKSIRSTFSYYIYNSQQKTWYNCIFVPSNYTKILMYSFDFSIISNRRDLCVSDSRIVRRIWLLSTRGSTTHIYNLWNYHTFICLHSKYTLLRLFPIVEGIIFEWFSNTCILYIKVHILVRIHDIQIAQLFMYK